MIILQEQCQAESNPCPPERMRRMSEESEFDDDDDEDGHDGKGQKFGGFTSTVCVNFSQDDLRLATIPGQEGVCIQKYIFTNKMGRYPEKQMYKKRVCIQKGRGTSPNQHLQHLSVLTRFPFAGL